VVLVCVGASALAYALAEAGMIGKIASQHNFSCGAAGAGSAKKLWPLEDGAWSWAKLSTRSYYGELR